MGKSAFKGIFLLLLWSALALPPQAGFGQEYSRVIKKELDISKGGVISLNNKYGSVAVEGWQQPRAKVEARILVRASDESSAQRVFSRIRVAFEEGPDYASAATEIDPQKKEWWFWSEKEADYSISYKAYIPYECALIVENKYGDVSIDNMAGRTELSVRYGNLRADQLRGDSKVTLEHGMGVIEEADRLKVSLQQARLRLENARLLEIDSRYSRIWIDQASEILSRSKYDTYEVGRVNRFVNEGKFDNIDIETAEEVLVNSTLMELYVERVNKSLELQADSSGVKIASIGRNFRNVDIAGSFTNFRLGIENGAAYQLDAVADFAGIQYPRSLKVIYEKEAGANHEVRGHAGTDKAPRLLRARVSYGALRVAQD